MTCVRLGWNIRSDARGQPGELVERSMPAPMVLPFAALAFLLLLIEALPRSAFDRVRLLMRRAAWPRPRAGVGVRAAALLCVGLLSLLPARGPAAPRRNGAAAPATGPSRG